MRRDGLEEDGTEGSIKLPRKPKVETCCVSTCQYGAGGSKLNLCCDLMRLEICDLWLKSLLVTSFAGRV